MSQQVTGTVQNKRKDGKGMKIDEQWYSVYNSSSLSDVNKGDTVSFSYTSKGQWNNIDEDAGITVTNAAPAQSSGGGNGGGYSKGGDKQFRSVPELTRIDALKYSLEFHNTGYVDPAMSTNEAIESILRTSELFVAYIEGKIDLGTEQPAPAPEPAPEPEPKPEPAPEPAVVKSALNSFLGG